MSETKYVYSGTLQHWGKGKEAESHKYTARQWVKGKWQYIYGKMGGDAKATRDAAAEKAQQDADKSSKAYKTYVNNRYTNEQYQKDLDDRGYSKDAPERSKAQTEAAIQKTYDTVNNPADNLRRDKNKDVKKQFNDFRSSPGATDFRYFDAKFTGDRSRQKRAQEAARQSAQSNKDAKVAQLAYDKTLLGKVEKGMNILKKLLKRG